MSSKKRELHAARHGQVSHSSPEAHQSPIGIGHGPTLKPTPVIPNVHDGDRDNTIRVRAYDFWERAGRPDDDGAREGFWYEAEKELTAARASS